jgi:hypothetical protein
MCSITREKSVDEVEEEEEKNRKEVEKEGDDFICKNKSCQGTFGTKGTFARFFSQKKLK